MKHLTTYKIFESSNTDELLDLLRSDIDNIGIDENDMYASTCVFICKKDGYPIARPTIEWDMSFYTANDTALKLGSISGVDVNFTDIYKSNIGSTSMKFKKTPELNKKGMAIFHGPTFDESFNNDEEISDDNETAYEKNTRYVNNIYNGLNKVRFNEYGYDYVIATDTVGRKLILFFRIGGDIKEKPGARKSTWNPHDNESKSERYLKSYKIFESLDTVDVIRVGIEDIALDLKDTGLVVTVFSEVGNLQKGGMFIRVTGGTRSYGGFKVIDNVEQLDELKVFITRVNSYLIDNRFSPESISYDYVGDDGEYQEDARTNIRSFLIGFEEGRYINEDRIINLRLYYTR